MSGTLTVRLLRALLAFWFVLSVGEPSVVRICPMHASAAAELANAGEMSMPAHHAGHTASSHSHSSGQHRHHCTCINCCVAAASSAALAASRVQLVAAPVVAFATLAPSSQLVAPRDDPPHLLPPGTGPPRV